MSIYAPRLRLTPEEKEWCSKYYDPLAKNSKPGVLYRLYPAVLELNETQRNPIFQFSISRRCRIWGVDMSGDLEQMRLQFEDTTGEQYTPDPVEPALLLSGSMMDVQSSSYLQTTANSPAIFPFRGLSALRNYPQTYVFEPNIVLRPNQTLEVSGRETQAPVVVIPEKTLTETIAPFRIDLTLKVWEFPGMEGGEI